jgi:hypothetical protein
MKYDTTPPDPVMVRVAREASDLTMAAAGALVHVSAEVWRTWEAPLGSPRHRQMDAAHWELFQRKAPKPTPAKDRMTDAELRAWVHGSDRAHIHAKPRRKRP